MHGWMDEGIKGKKDAWMDVIKEKRMGGWMDERKERMKGSKKLKMDGWMNG